jgi:hypothetical protein
VNVAEQPPKETESVVEARLEFTSPQYYRASIADVLPSVCDGLGVPGAFDILGLGPAPVVAVVVVDGLGAGQLHRYADHVPFLAGAVRRDITSVFPSTTAAGLTSIGTGLSPGEHGIVGAAFRLGEDNHLLKPLSWSHHPEPHSVQGEPTWWARARSRGVNVNIVSPRAYSHAGLSVAALGGADYLGADGPGERAQTMVDALSGKYDATDSGKRLVYGYWEWLDKTAHVRGVGSDSYVAELEAVDRFLQQLVSGAPSGSRIIVTADHGVLDCPEILDLDQLPKLHRGVRLVAGEPRMRHVYVAPGQQDSVADSFADALQDAAVVLTRREALETGWFGPVVAEHEVRIGDVVLVAKGRIRLALPSRDRIVSGLIGQHGSLTAAEMLVPLAIWDV